MSKIQPIRKIIPYQAHHISGKNIPPNAISVIQHLKAAGFEAYLVGGCVRDLLVHQIPKDFDVATNALPNQVRQLFRRCRLIGRRFRLAHVYFGREIIEVATFRASHEGASEDKGHTKNGVIVRDNVYGTIEEDAMRRDFTLNALYYDPITKELLDFCDGFKDIQQQTIRIIDDAKKRYNEDPIRMLRAMRFAGKLKFHLTPDTAEPIEKSGNLLQHVPAARLYDEILKLFHCGAATAIFPLLREYKLFKHLFPSAYKCFEQSENPVLLTEQLFKNTDKRICDHQSLSPYFLFAAILWPAVKLEFLRLRCKNKPNMQALEQATRTILDEQLKSILIPNRITAIIREIWLSQQRLESRRPRSITRLLTQQRFRATYDLLLLRSQTGEVPKEIADWWTNIQSAKSAEQNRMIQALHQPSKSA